MTPPREATSVRIPVGLANGFADAFAALPATALIATKVVESKKGDTPDRLAEKHGISTRSVRSFNPKLRLLKSGRLAPGQAVLLPSPSVAAVALAIPDPSIEKFPKRRAHSRVHSSSQKGMKQGAGSHKASARVSSAKKKSKSLRR